MLVGEKKRYIGSWLSVSSCTILDLNVHEYYNNTIDSTVKQIYIKSRCQILTKVKKQGSNKPARFIILELLRYSVLKLPVIVT